MLKSRRRRADRSWLVALAAAQGLCCSTQAEPEPVLEPAELQALALTGVELSPQFTPTTRDYSAEVNVLAHALRLRALASAEVRITLESATTTGSSHGELSVEVPLSLGSNRLKIEVTAADHTRQRYTLHVTRHPEPWRNVEVLNAPEPLANGYFGDYLRATHDHLYVNWDRRGQLYRRVEDHWARESPSETLLPFELEWMYEAAIDDDTLALVAQPAGGTEMLYWFTRDANGAWSLSGEHEAGAQGTLRLFADDLVFITEARILFFRREQATFHWRQTLDAPAAGIGFAARPTYFDSRGVSLSNGVLVVGAPRDATREGSVQQGAFVPCAPGSGVCAEASGALFIYERDAQGHWSQTTYLKPPQSVPGLQFGLSAAAHGDWVAVGTRYESSAEQGVLDSGVLDSGPARVCNVETPGECHPESGVVYLFHRGPAGWQAAGAIKPSLSRAYDYFGDTLLLRGDVLLVGAPGQDSAVNAPLTDTSSPDSGGIFVFLREGNRFRELGLHKLAQEHAAPYPFPEELQSAGHGLVVSASFASQSLPNGELLENAGRVYSLR